MQIPETKTEDPRVTRSKRAVLDATLELLSERGAAATTIEGISDLSGVAKTTIYRHWDTKADLFIAAFDSLVETPRDANTGSFTGDLEALAKGLARGLRSGRAASLLPTLVEAAERDPEMAKLHARFAAARTQVALLVIRRGRERGEVRDDLSDEEIVALIAGPLFYARMVEHEPPTEAAAEHLARLVAELASSE